MSVTPFVERTTPFLSQMNLDDWVVCALQCRNIFSPNIGLDWFTISRIGSSISVYQNKIRVNPYFYDNNKWIPKIHFKILNTNKENYLAKCWTHDS